MEGTCTSFNPPQCLCSMSLLKSLCSEKTLHFFYFKIYIFLLQNMHFAYYSNMHIVKMLVVNASSNMHIVKMHASKNDSTIFFLIH